MSVLVQLLRASFWLLVGVAAGPGCSVEGVVGVFATDAASEASDGDMEHNHDSAVDDAAKANDDHNDDHNDDDDHCDGSVCVQ